MSNVLRSYLHHVPFLGQKVMVDPSSIVIGQVILADDVNIWPLVVIRGDVNSVTIGQRTNIQDGSVLHVTRSSSIDDVGFPLIVGADVTIGHKVILHGCTIGDRVLVGMGTIVLDGAHIEDDVLIGAGSLISPGKHLQSGYLYLGSPAKKIRALSTEELAWLKKSAQHYVDLKNDYLSE